MLLLLVIPLLALTVSTGCRTPGSQETPKEEVKPIIVGMIPDLPELPDWPDLEWHYIDGWYCIDEADADQLLDYWENLIPEYLWEIEQYKKKLAVVITAI